jgi:hypothetical protein
MHEVVSFAQTKYVDNPKLAQILAAKAKSLSAIVLLPSQCLKSFNDVVFSKERVFFFDITKKSKRYGGSFLVNVNGQYQIVSDSKLKLSADIVGKLIHSEPASMFF